MARLLANSTSRSLLGSGRDFQSEDYRKPRRCVKMMYTSQTSVLSIQSFSGLRASNALDRVARPSHDFFGKVNLQMSSSRREKASRGVTKAMFERFTEKAIKVIMLSQEEARRLGHNFVGTEQILLGLIGEGTGIAAKILHGLRERYEIHHKLRYTDEALVAAAQLSHQYISDRFLPDKAIDLIDEAGSRVRLRHAQVPEEARELERQLRQITKEKNEAVRGQDFEKAGSHRDREIELRAEIAAVLAKGKEVNKAETEAGEEGGPTVTESDIQHIVSTWTGIPVEKVSSDESSRLLKMEQTLHTRVIGQDEAVKAISRAIRRARVGLKNPNRPIASFIFSGPTGVGKSELAKALAAYYFGSEEAMIRLDMSEFMERHTVSKLIGSPPGYVGYTEGGQLTEAVRRRPYTLVLFDEIEKAHPDVFNMMLQILEDGRLTDSKGRTVDFKNTLLIMTSNVGSSVIEKGGRRIGFDLDYDEKDSSYNRIKSLVTEELKQYFRPEFLNRLDEMIVFRQLTKLEVKEIADIMLKEVVVRLKDKEIELQVTERFKERVVDEGFDPSYGARPLRRAIMRLLEDSMAEKMLSREIKDGDSVIVDVDAEGSVVVLNGKNGSGDGFVAEEAMEDPIPVL
ncbi:hypothetical protein BRARA_F01646 [Brassica rapa]|uniref:Clp R domain-containing protein n=1 Tax=Brassica campestris TaxID=3711 RepID=A0A397Z4V0_BRACM|nr:hypothetical protein BRARA_F01646 [Brassica rapa]